MALKPAQKTIAIDVVGFVQAVTGFAPKTAGQLDTFVHKYQDVGRSSFIESLTKTSAFRAKYQDGGGEAKLNEAKLIRDVFSNLGLKAPTTNFITNYSKKYANDSDLLLSKLLALPGVINKLKALATPFVEKALEAPAAAPYGDNLKTAVYNEAPTGLNMDGSTMLMVDEDAIPGTILAPLVAIDTAGDTHTFEITSGGTFFEVVETGNGPVLAYKGGADVAADTAIPVSVKVTDQAGESVIVDLNVTVKDVPVVAPPVPAQPTVPGQLVEGDEGGNLFTAAVDAISGVNTLTGALIDGKGGTDTLKVLVASTQKQGPAVIPTVEIGYIEGSKVLAEPNEAVFVGNFHAEDVEVFHLKQAGANDVAVDLGGMGSDLEKIISDSAQAEKIYFLNIHEADGLAVEINHTKSWHVVDFKRDSIDGDETVEVAVSHVGQYVPPYVDPKHPDAIDKDYDPGEKGIKIAFSEGLGTASEHHKAHLANLEQIDLVFNGTETNVIKAIEVGTKLDSHDNVIDGLETITGRGSADAIVGSLHHTLFYTNPYLQNIDMSATSGDNTYVITWGDRMISDVSENGSDHSIWKVPTYDAHGHPNGHKDLTFKGGSGDETVYLGNGAVGLTADGGAGNDAILFSDIPTGKDNSFTGFEVAKILEKVGGPYEFAGDPTDEGTDVFDLSAISGIYNVEFSCGVECFKPLPEHECDVIMLPVLTLVNGDVPAGYDDSPYEYVTEANLALINLEANKEYTFTFKDHKEEESHSSSDPKKEEEHKPRYWGEPEKRDDFVPYQEGKSVTIVADVGILDTEGHTNAGDGTNDVLNLVLEQDLDVNFIGGETEVLNVEGATYDGWGRHHITFIKQDVEQTAVPQWEDEEETIPWLDEHGDQIVYYEDKVKHQVEIAEDLTTINLTGEADYFAITGEATKLTPNLTLIDATGTTGDTRLFVKDVGSATEGLEVRGTANDDIIHGTEAGDKLLGNDGDDELFGNGGDDDLQGGNGVDVLHGGAGADLIDGGDGADWMSGGGATPTIKKINIEGKIGDGDTYKVIIEAHGKEVAVETTFHLHGQYGFHKWVEGHCAGKDLGGKSWESWLWSLDEHSKEKLKLAYLQEKIAYNLNDALDHKGLGDEIDVYVNHHKELVVEKASGLDFELSGLAWDDHYKEDHPEMATVTIEVGHYDYHDVVKVDLYSDGVGPKDGKYQLTVSDDLDTNHDHYVDEKEVAAALAKVINDDNDRIADAVVLEDGATIKLTGRHDKGFTQVEVAPNDPGYDGSTEVVDARAHISFTNLPSQNVTLMFAGFSTELDLEDLDGNPSDQDAAVIAQIIDQLGIGYDVIERSESNGTGIYTFKSNAEPANVVATVEVLFKDGKGSLEIHGPKSGDPFPNTALADTAKIVIEGSDSSKDDDVTIYPQLWTKVTDNDNPWVENLINDKTEDISFEDVQDGQLDGSDIFIISEENPIPQIAHPKVFKPGDEKGLVDMVKDFVTHWAEDLDAKIPLVADKIDFDGFDVAGTALDAFLAIETVAGNYKLALEAAQALHDIFEETTYIASTYQDGSGFSTAVFAFDNTDTGNAINVPDSAVILVGVGPDQVTGTDIIA